MRTKITASACALAIVRNALMGCVVALLGIALANADTPAQAPFINHTKNRSRFCTTVSELAADVNKDSRIKLVLVGKFSDDQVCGELKFPYDADDVAHFLVHHD